ncbi:hypothetical protein BT96DRAFT_945860 [Gymnopus androsaceus JB14]|uniref:Uncharacterized protein n=1 Tax=Gymnopus androsaceus JB14 TaxID=1447944 RepID=A0A6A4GYH2_9AGAR|nr:hypothetical protein BT96DRAFT_945860 [Gymnopus androsaceus JB14]
MCPLNFHDTNDVLPPAKRRKRTHAPPDAPFVARCPEPHQIREELVQHQALSSDTRIPEYLTLSPTPAPTTPPHSVIGIPSPEIMQELAEHQSARIKALENATRTPNVIPEYLVVLEGLFKLLESPGTFEEKVEAAEQLFVDVFERKWGEAKIKEFIEKVKKMQSGK